MKNIINYAKEYAKTFNEKGFNEIDSLVFSQLSYLNIGEFWKQNGEKPLSLQEVYESTNKKIFAIRRGDDNKKLLKAMIEGVRFHDVKIIDHIDIKDETIDEQFSATVYAFANTAYVAFRGTDRSMIGWSEDINKGYMDVVPAEQDSVLYLNRIADALPQNFYVGGHSKGGHLAIFSTTYCENSIKSRIIRIFNHDGPGMDKAHFESDNYSQIRDKIITTLPENSFFGIMLYSDDNFYIVKSNAFWLQQHDPFSWCIKYNSFVYEKSLSSSSLRLKKSMNTWLNDNDQEHRALFFKVLTDFIDETKAQRPLDIGLNLAKTLPMFFATYDKLLPEDLEKIKYMLRLFFKLLVTAETSGHTEKPLKLVEGFKIFKGNIMPKKAVAYDILGNEIKNENEKTKNKDSAATKKNFELAKNLKQAFFGNEEKTNKQNQKANKKSQKKFDDNLKQNDMNDDKFFNIDLKNLLSLNKIQFNAIKKLFNFSDATKTEAKEFEQKSVANEAKVIKSKTDDVIALEPDIIDVAPQTPINKKKKNK